MENLRPCISLVSYNNTTFTFKSYMESKQKAYIVNNESCKIVSLSELKLVRN